MGCPPSFPTAGSGAQRQLRLGRPGLLRRDRSRSAHELVDVEPDRECDDHDTGNDCQPPRNQGVHSIEALLPRCPPSQEQLEKVSASRTLLPDGDGVKGVSAADRSASSATAPGAVRPTLSEWPKGGLGGWRESRPAEARRTEAGPWDDPDGARGRHPRRGDHRHRRPPWHRTDVHKEGGRRRRGFRAATARASAGSRSEGQQGSRRSDPYAQGTPLDTPHNPNCGAVCSPP